MIPALGSLSEGKPHCVGLAFETYDGEIRVATDTLRRTNVDMFMHMITARACKLPVLSSTFEA